ncbi:BamA/TamA family outer membrane protein [soil metagenome]
MKFIFPYKRVCIIVITATTLVACSNTRNIPDGDALYTGASVKIKKSEITKKQQKVLKEDLTKLTRPRPNSKFLGIRFKLSLHNLGGPPEKRKGFISKFLRKFGEPPVLLSNLNLETNITLLKNVLENRGFFYAAITGDTTVKRKKASAHYDVVTGPQYTINSIAFPPDSSGLLSDISATKQKTLLKPGAPFNLDLIKGERERIDAYLKEHGYFYFSPEYLLINVDSTIGNHKVNMYITLKPATPVTARVPYTINDVFVYSNYNLNTAAADTNKSNRTFYKGYYVVDKDKMFRPSIFEKIMIFKPGDLYNRRDHNVALSRLINLGVYKFVKNRFEQVPDSNKLNAYYYLTPLPAHNISAEITGTSKSNNMVGTFVTFRWTDKNIARRAEKLSIHASAGTEVQYSGTKSGFNTYRLGGGFTYLLPRFVIPFFSLNSYGPYVPKSHITFEYSILNRRKLYTLNSFSGELGYIWKPQPKKEHRLNPFSVTYVQPINVTQIYIDSLAKEPTLKKAIEKQFTIGSNYNYTYEGYDRRSDAVEGWFFNGNVDLSGNILGLLTGANAKAGNVKQLFNADFSQYIRTEADVRRYIRVGLKSTWANRLDLGFGLPYGNSLELPFIKQFFVGGNNSVRAFRSRSLGPGTYRPANADSSNFIPDQSGDIKLELNTEFRYKLNNFIEPAFFIDAGNIWLFNDNPLKPGSKFSNKFLSELAIGAGAGLRFDFQILLLRIDVAFPLRVPWRDAGQRSVINQINFSSGSWRDKNLVFNLAIGYPF